jgi:hypothetical protein
MEIITRKFLGVFICMGIICSCTNQSAKEEKSEEKPLQNGTLGYDMVKPVNSWTLPDSLKEISGIVKTGKNSMLAIEDLHALIYELSLDSGHATVARQVLFLDSTGDDKKIDMEDLAMVKDTIYALWSHGGVFKIKNWKGKLQTTEFKTSLDKDNDTEGLAWDPETGNLLIACKAESDVEDQKKSTRAIYQFDLKKDILIDSPFLLIDPKHFESFTKDKVDFYPSAIAVHPKTHDIYIISTKGNKAMAVYSHDGKLKGFDYLDKDLLKKPEGICFDESGNLYISSESTKEKAAVIYQFAPASIK